MATREKTIQQAWTMYTADIADATLTSIGSITLYCPEAAGSGVTFTSVTVEVGFQDIITATGGTINETRCALTLSGAGASTVTELDDLLNTGENISGVFAPFDFTSYFNTNFGTGTSKSCECNLYFDHSTGTTLGMRNCTAIITMTYTYDDTDTTQIKTAYIPLESLVGALATTAGSEIGTNQIPALDTFLPEDSVTIRDYFFVIEGNNANQNATDFTLSYRIDAEANASFGVQECGLQTETFDRWVIDRKGNIPDTSTTHEFRFWSSLATRVHHCCITLVVTYEFDASATTTTLNSVLIPFEYSSPAAKTASTEADRFSRTISIQEPATITLRQSAVRLNFNTADAAVSGINLRAGAQSYRTYTHLGGVVAGMFCLQQRIDSGGAQGAGFTAARGFNEINIDLYHTDSTDEMTNLNGLIILNYESGVHADGVGAHNHTVIKKMYDHNAQLQDYVTIADFSFSIPEAKYWITEAGFVLYHWVSAASNCVTLDVQALTGEGKEQGFYSIYIDAYTGDAERACSIIFMRGRNCFKRYPSDPDSERLDIETARDYRLYSTTVSGYGLLAMITYHSIDYAIAGTISDSDGGSVTIEAFRSDTGEKIGETSRTGDGAYSIDWYDNTVDVYTVAYEDGTHKGRSDNDVAA